ncbi:MAG: winged helix-turn-helix domain-containing protein [Allosphingosinicella sp.]
MGPGKAELLRQITAQGSISAAARAMGMSYRRAWLLVDAMNRCFRRPLVEARPGRGGARVTGEGARLLAAYEKLSVHLRAEAHNPALAELQAAVLARPREP